MDRRLCAAVAATTAKFSTAFSECSMQSEPPPGSARLPIFYLGTAVSVIGVLLFLSVFVTFIANFGNFDHFDERARSSGFRALGGMVLIVVGGVIASAAGSKRVSSRLVAERRSSFATRCS